MGNKAINTKIDTPHHHRLEFFLSLNPDADEEAIQLMDSFLKVSHAMRQLGEHSVESTGLTYSKFRLMLRLLLSEQVDNSTGLSPSEMSTMHGISRNTVSALIKDLEEDGLIERHLDVQDRRRFNIFLSDAGRDMVRKHASDHIEIISTCFQNLDSEDRDYLVKILTDLRQSIDDTRETMSSVDTKGVKA